MVDVPPNQTLKSAQINVLSRLIWGFMINGLKLSHNTMDATKNIVWATGKGEGAVDHSTGIR